MTSSSLRKNRRQDHVEILETRQMLSSSLNIVPTFDSTITKDKNATAIEAAINAGIKQIEGDFSNPITVRITFEENGGFAGSETKYVDVSYSSYRKALVSHATSDNDASAIASLPTGSKNPVNGSTEIALTTPEARVLGLIGESSSDDGTVSFDTADKNLTRTSIDSSKYDLQAAVMHEMDEVLGTGSVLVPADNGKAAPTGAIHAEDLYRYTSSGARSFNTTVGAKAYYSIDGGKTDLAQFNQTSGGDRGDLAPGTGGLAQVQDAFDAPGVIPVYNLEITRLDVLGYTPTFKAGLGIVTGAVYNDANGNGKQSSSEKDLSGWTIEAIQNGKVVTTCLSNASGYQLTGLSSGTYTIVEVLKSGYKQTSPASSYTVKITGTKISVVTGKDFGDEKSA